MHFASMKQLLGAHGSRPWADARLGRANDGPPKGAMLYRTVRLASSSTAQRQRPPRSPSGRWSRRCWGTLPLRR